MKQILSELIAALEELRAVSNEQQEQLKRTRARAGKMQEAFEASLSEMLSGNRASRQKFTESLDLGRRDVTHSHSLSVRRVTAFLDASRALMHLYAYSDARGVADCISELLRQIRLIDVADPPVINDLSPLPSNDEDSVNQDERQRRTLEDIRTHQERMRAYVERNQRRADAHIEQADLLLDEAISLANSFLGAQTLG